MLVKKSLRGIKCRVVDDQSELTPLNPVLLVILSTESLLKQGRG